MTSDYKIMGKNSKRFRVWIFGKSPRKREKEMDRKIYEAVFILGMILDIMEKMGARSMIASKLVDHIITELGPLHPYRSLNINRLANLLSLFGVGPRKGSEKLIIYYSDMKRVFNRFLDPDNPDLKGKKRRPKIADTWLRQLLEEYGPQYATEIEYQAETNGFSESETIDACRRLELVVERTDGHIVWALNKNSFDEFVRETKEINEIRKQWRKAAIFT